MNIHRNNAHIFRPHRSKSQSICINRKRIYSKIKETNPSQSNWLAILNYQLEIRQVISELGRIEFSQQQHQNKKSIIRQTFMKRKQIIKCIQDEDYDQIQSKIQKMTDIVSNLTDKNMLISVIFLFQIRRIVLGKGKVAAQLSAEQTEDLIQKMKDKVSDFLVYQDNDVTKIKIYSVLALYLLRYNNILMDATEKNIVYKTVELKKKKMVMLDNQADRMKEFQSLLFILFELYKNLFLLKKDQQCILFYYNQISAYLQLYKTKFKGFSAFDEKFQMTKRLQQMKPSLLNLNIYEDSEIRQKLAFVNIQNQILGQQSQKEIVTIEGKTVKTLKHLDKQKLDQNDGVGQSKHSRTSFISVQSESSKSINMRISLRRNKMLRLSNMKLSDNKDFVLEQTQHNIELEHSLVAIKPQQFRFPFLFLNRDRLYVGSFQVNFRNSATMFDLIIKVDSSKLYLSYVKLIGIINKIDHPHIQAFTKFLWRVFIKIVYNGKHNNFSINQIGLQEVAKEYVPNEVQRQYELTSLMRLHNSITTFFRKDDMRMEFGGEKVKIQHLDINQINLHFEKQFIQMEKKKDKILFNKRNAQMESHQILETMFRKIHKDTLTIILFSKVDFQYNILKITYEKYIKLAEILEIGTLPHFKTQFIYQKINQNRSIKRISRKKAFTQRISNLLNFHQVKPIKDFVRHFKRFNIQEQLHIEKKQEQTSKNSFIIKTLFNNTKNSKPKSIKPPQKQLMQACKMSNGQFILLRKMQYANYIYYFNHKFKIYFPKCSNNNDYYQEKPQSYERIRMYKIISQKTFIKDKKIMHRFYKPRFSSVIIEQYQLINLNLVRHQIYRASKGYKIIIQYQTPSYSYLYELISDSHRYMGVTNKRIVHLQKAKVDEQEIQINHVQLKCIPEGNKRILSEANQYFNTINFKNTQFGFWPNHQM